MATTLEHGEATYLDGVRYANQIDTMRSVLYRAKWAYVRAVMKREHTDLSGYSRGIKQDEIEQQPVGDQVLRYTEYPYPTPYRGHLERAFNQLGNAKGLKQLTTKMQRTVSQAPTADEFVTFDKDYQIEQLEEFPGKAKTAGYDCEWFGKCLDDYKRLQAAGITTEHELRAALAELIPHLTPVGSDDPVTIAIDELRGKKLPGFFPTPVQ